ncbi:hypothetical protein Angca_000130 [Angiostrongylus cantonensis]|nr:hypothetical protein Angca_000130 [Angiostrongylus cantonensis]
MSSSGDLVTNSDERDLEVHSAYEDALDESDTELKLLCLAAAKRLTKQRPRPHSIVLPSLLCSPSSTDKHKRSSSSDNSSIEKLADGSQSRRAIADRAERPRRSGQKSSSNNSESPEDWKMVNYTFQNATNNPLLMQIHQQMQMLSRQLYDIESTNALQLRIISKLLSKLIKVQQWPRNILARFFRFLQVLFIVLMGPFVVKAIRRLFCKSQQGMAVNPFPYW